MIYANRKTLYIITNYLYVCNICNIRANCVLYNTTFVNMVQSKESLYIGKLFKVFSFCSIYYSHFYKEAAVIVIYYVKKIHLWNIRIILHTWKKSANRLLISSKASLLCSSPSIQQHKSLHLKTVLYCISLYYQLFCLKYMLL